MNALKAVVPALLLITACKKSDECKVETVEVSVTVNDNDGEPIDAMVDIDGEPCPGSAGSYTCTAVVPILDVNGEPDIANQVTATNFPFNQPAAQRVDSVALTGAECEAIAPMELRMLPAQN